MHSKQIFFVLSIAGLLISALANATQQDGDAGNGRLADLNYFQVESRAVLFGRESTTVDAEVRLLEQYSNELGRARLEFQSQEEHATSARDDGQSSPSSSQVKYIFSAKSDKLMKVSKVTNGIRCEPGTRAALASDLFGLDAGEQVKSWLKTTQMSDSRAPELAHWERLLSGPNMPRHVIGFARLLLFVELNRQSFRRDERPHSATVRNTQVERYKLTFEVHEWPGDQKEESRWVASIAGKQATLIIYLSKDSGAEGQPFRVWLQLPSGAELIVEFSSVGPMRAAPGDLMSAFNFPLGRGCSQQLDRGESKDAGGNEPVAGGHKPPPAQPLSREKRASQAVFSFEAELSELWFHERPAQLDHLFVAYDAHAKALRVDSRAVGDIERAATTTIYDFVLGRKYHLRTGGRGGPEMGRVMLSVDSSRDRASSGRQCLVTRIMAKEQADMLPPYGEETILPRSSLIEMGSALVRGIETRVYEMVDERLPKFLFQQVAYLDSTGQEQLAFNFKRKVSVSASSTPGETQTNLGFSIVYFVATTSGDDQLIRVDVYQRDALLYRVDVHNFQWRLQDAPDGQSEQELFSLGDSGVGPENCLLQPDDATTTTTTTGGILHNQRPPARMQLELVYVENAQMFHVLPPDIIELLASPPARQKALIRSLAGYPSNSLFASQMCDLKTTISGLTHMGTSGNLLSFDGSSIRLDVDLQLAGLTRIEDVALRAISIGTALVSSGLRKPSAKSTTLEQCFWEAAQEFASTGGRGGSETSTVVLFSFCSSKCWIDSQATAAESKQPVNERKDQPVEYQSSVFIVSVVANRRLPCQLLRVQRDRTNQAKQLSGPDRQLVRPWQDVQQNLHNKILSLVFVNEQRSNNTTTQTYVRQPELLFKVSKVKLTATNGEEDLDDDSHQVVVVDGVSLPAEAGLDTFQMAPSDEALDQAPEICHAHCVSHLDCRSYSICHAPFGQQPGAECVISALELDTGALNKQLIDFYQLDKQSAERKSNRIPATALAGNTSTGKEEKILLHVNRRCQVRTIRAQEMFVAVRHGERGASKRRAVWQAHLLPVADLSECAQMCLRKNVNFFKRLKGLSRPANTGERGDRSPEVAGGEKSVELRNQLSDAMRFWCDEFHFLDSKLEPVSYQLMGDLRKAWTEAGFPQHQTTSGDSGLCYLARPEWALVDHTPPPPSQTKTEKVISEETTATGEDQEPNERKRKPALVKLPFGVHGFRYSLLYQRNPGFRLARTNANDPENVPSLIITNNQSIESHPPDIDFCARQCFAQAAHWCRSFDVLSFAVADRSSSSLSCVYNSLSLHDVGGGENPTQLLLKQQMSITQKSQAVSYDHYEPHQAYALDNVALGLLNELESAGQLARLATQPLDDNSHSPAGTVLNFIVCILLGLCTGLLVALLLVKRFYHRGDRVLRHVRSHIDVPRLSREFICMQE